eukprot:2698975-Pyramimonas_sp.AAC.1
MGQRCRVGRFSHAWKIRHRTWHGRRYILLLFAWALNVLETGQTPGSDWKGMPIRGGRNPLHPD